MANIFHDKTAYVWGLRYQWDPSLSRNPVSRFPHIMPPWCDAVESNETHGCPARHYFAILSMSLSPGSYCNDSDAVAGVIRARLNAAISESPQADQAQVSQNWLEIVLIVRAATRWLIAPPPGCNSPMTESMESERPAFTSEHRHQCLRCTAHSDGHQIIVKWSPSRFSLRDYPSSPRIHKINVKIFRQILFFIKIQKLSENQTAGDNSYLGTSHFVGFLVVLIPSCFFWKNIMRSISISSSITLRY